METWTGRLTHQTQDGALQGRNRARRWFYRREWVFDGSVLIPLDHVIPPLPNCRVSFVWISL